MSEGNGKANGSTGGWFRVDDAAVDRIPTIGVLAFAVYGVLKKHQNRQTGLCCPSLTTITKGCKASRRSVLRALDRLEAAGMVGVVKAETRGCRGGNQYKLIPLRDSDTRKPFPPERMRHQETNNGFPVSPNPPANVDTRKPEPEEALLTRGIQPECAPAAPDGPPPGLVPWLKWWNGLHSQGLVCAGVNEAHPAAEVLRGWKRVEKDATLRDMIADRDTIEAEIRQSEFLQTWPGFGLEYIFGAKTRQGAVLIERLLRGGYRNGRNGKQPVGAGQRHKTADYGKDGTFG